MPSLFTDALAWAVVLGFVTSVGLNKYNQPYARYLGAITWGAFGVFWALLVPFFAFEQQSFIEGGLALLALPACLHTGYLLYNGRDSLFRLSYAVAIMGAIYLATETITPVQRALIEVVTIHTEWGITQFGASPEVVVGNKYYDGFRNLFVFQTEDGHTINFYIRMACTGIGSMAIVAGLVSALEEPLRKRVSVLAVTLPIIYVLNIARTTFIAIAYGQQRFHYQPDLVMRLFGETDPYSVSYLLADKVISQILAVIVLLCIAFYILRALPSITTVFEDILYVLTRTEYDLDDLR